jgi:hypothetical protein
VPDVTGALYTQSFNLCLTNKLKRSVITLPEYERIFKVIYSGLRALAAEKVALDRMDENPSFQFEEGPK